MKRNEYDAWQIMGAKGKPIKIVPQMGPVRSLVVLAGFTLIIGGAVIALGGLATLISEAVQAGAWTIATGCALLVGHMMTRRT